MARRSARIVRPDREVLKSFLAATSRPAGTLQYHQLQGFLFSVASAPELILPSEWLPMVFAQQTPGYRSVAEARSIVDELVLVYNEINGGVAAGAPTLPGDCVFRDDALKNLESDAPVSQWSHGFTLGYDWLSDLWTPYVPEDDDVFGAIVMVLSFFTSRRLAEAYRKELKLPGALKVTATTMRGLFPESVREYARLGRMISDAAAEHGMRRTQPSKISRANRRTRRR
jgi:yecA family protein